MVSLPFRLSWRRMAAVLLLAAGALGFNQLDAWQRQAIFSPQTDQQRWWREPPAGTEVFDLALPNGDKVHAWYWQSPRRDAPTVLYLHGARWNLNGSAFRMEGWTRMGYSMLAIDYRGFGQSTPLLPSEQSARRTPPRRCRNRRAASPIRRAASSTATAWAAPSPSTWRRGPICRRSRG